MPCGMLGWSVGSVGGSPPTEPADQPSNIGLHRHHHIVIALRILKHGVAKKGLEKVKQEVAKKGVGKAYVTQWEGMYWLQ